MSEYVGLVLLGVPQDYLQLPVNTFHWDIRLLKKLINTNVDDSLTL